MIVWTKKRRRRRRVWRAKVGDCFELTIARYPCGWRLTAWLNPEAEVIPGLGSLEEAMVRAAFELPRGQSQIAAREQWVRDFWERFENHAIVFVDETRWTPSFVFEETL